MEVIELDNKVKFLFEPLSGVEILACTVFIPSGSCADKVPGLTMLSLRTGFKRSGRRSALDFAVRQERLGTPFLSDVSADYSCVKFQCLSGGAGEFFRLFKEVVELPDFSGESFAVEKDTLIASIRAKMESGVSVAFDALSRLTYSGSLYENPPYGTQESVSSIDLKTAKNRFSEVVLTKGTVVSACGKLRSLEDILSALESIETAESPQKPFTVAWRDMERCVVKRKGSVQGVVALAVPAAPVSCEYPAWKLLNTLIGEGTGSVLFQEVREKRSLAYSTGSFYSARFYAGRLFLYACTSIETLGKVAELLCSLVKNLPDFVTEGAVARARNYLLGGYELDIEARSRRSWYSGSWELCGMGYGWGEHFVARVRNISLPEIKAIAERVATGPYHMVVVEDA